MLRRGGDGAPLLAGLLALSDERDQWERVALDWARSAWRCGYQAGRDAG